MTTDALVVDLFAGPGGWDVGAAELELRPVGGEVDPNPCATRAAAGLTTIRADVAATPAEPFAAAVGLIASPPCQAFSRAGRRDGKDDAARLRGHVLASVRQWRDVDPDGWADPRSPLVLEPLRWVHAIRPEWVALEQVPPIAPLWQTMAVALDALGYRTATGILDAADYGVPQHRKRAVLIANRTRPVHLPRRTAPPPTMAAALGWQPGGEWLDRRNDQSQSGEVDPHWPMYRPATTIAGRLLVTDPGGNANRFNGKAKSRNDGYRVSVTEAAVLQGFPSSYPWAGRPGSIPEQIGNAVPPAMARAILGAVRGAYASGPDEIA